MKSSKAHNVLYKLFFTSTPTPLLRILVFSLYGWTLASPQPLQGLFRKWGLLDAVCFFGVMVRCKAFLPSGIHDNAVIQSASHLLPFTLREETIMACDGPLSTDETHSHFLDSCVCLCVYVLECLYVCVLCHQKGCFITRELHEIVTPL